MDLISVQVQVLLSAPLYGNFVKLVKTTVCKIGITGSNPVVASIYGGRSAVGLTRQIVALKIGSSNLLVHPRKLIGESVNGKPAVSKTVTWGSNPCSPAK